MKVFIGWSGGTSQKVAIAFREWLPSIVNSIEPFVSAEDIKKGERWVKNLSNELEDCTCAILCLTKENINSAWLNFELGVLSKSIETALLIPFLFNIDQRDLNGRPIQHFQSTSFTREEILKLVSSLNSATPKPVGQATLNKSFKALYAELELELSSILTSTTDSKQGNAENENDVKLNEILTLIKSNQTFLRNSKFIFKDEMEYVKKYVQSNQANTLKDEMELIKTYIQSSQTVNSKENVAIPVVNKYHYPLQTEFVNHLRKISNPSFRFIMALSYLRFDFPWLYDIGKDTVGLLKSNVSNKQRNVIIEEFRQIIEFSFDHPIVKEKFQNRTDFLLFVSDIPNWLIDYLKEIN